MTSHRSFAPQYRLDNGAAGFADDFQTLLTSKREVSEDIRDIVVSIIGQVQREGDTALFDLTERFDRHDRRQQGLRVTEEERAQARAGMTLEQADALNVAAERIRTYHEKHMPQDHFDTDEQADNDLPRIRPPFVDHNTQQNGNHSAQ